MKYTEYSYKLLTDLIDEWSHGLPDTELTYEDLHSLIEKDLSESIEWVDLDDISPHSKRFWMSMKYVVHQVAIAVWWRNKRYLEEFYENRNNIQKNK